MDEQKVRDAIKLISEMAAIAKIYYEATQLDEHKKRYEEFNIAIEALEYLEHLKKHDAVWHLINNELPPEGEMVLIKIKPRAELEVQAGASAIEFGTRIIMGFMRMEHGFPEFYEAGENICRLGFVPKKWMPISFLY